MRYRKRPVVIDAWVWDESRKTLNEIGCQMVSCTGHTDRPDEMMNLSIKVLGGSVDVCKGDYIIKGTKGEFYPCKPDIFEKTYEPVE